MAGYEWNQIQAPNFAPIAASQQLAAELLNKATSGATDALKGFRTDLQNQDNASLAAQLARVNTPQQLDSLSIPQYASPEAIAAISTRRDAMMEAALKQQEVTDRGAYWASSRAGADYELGQKRRQDAATQQLNTTIGEVNGTQGSLIDTMFNASKQFGVPAQNMVAPIISNKFKNLSTQEQSDIMQAAYAQLQDRETQQRAQQAQRVVDANRSSETAARTTEQAMKVETFNQAKADQDMQASFKAYVTPVGTTGSLSIDENEAVVQNKLDSWVDTQPESQQARARALANEQKPSLLAQRNAYISSRNKQLESQLLPQITKVQQDLANDPRLPVLRPEEKRQYLIKSVDLSSLSPEEQKQATETLNRVAATATAKEQEQFKTLYNAPDIEAVKKSTLTDQQKDFIASNTPQDVAILSGQQYEQLKSSKKSAGDVFAESIGLAKIPGSDIDLDAAIQNQDAVKTLLQRAGFNETVISPAAIGLALSKGMKSSSLTRDSVIDGIADIDYDKAAEFLKLNFTPNGQRNPEAETAYNNAYAKQDQAYLTVGYGQQLYKLTALRNERAKLNMDTTKEDARIKEITAKLQPQSTPATNSVSTLQSRASTPATQLTVLKEIDRQKQDRRNDWSSHLKQYKNTFNIGTPEYVEMQKFIDANKPSGKRSK